MNLKIGISILISCLSILACQKETHQAGIQPSSFFDLKEFFKEEEQALSGKIKSLHKEITINGKLEEQKIDSFDLNKELAIFIAADINRPAWLGQYQVDSLKDAQNVLKAINYKALKDNLKTKELTISYQDGEVTEIYVKKAISTMAATSFQELTYYKGKGYKNKNEQSMIFSEANAIQLDVKFLE